VQSPEKPLRHFEGARPDWVRRTYWKVKDALRWAVDRHKGRSVRVHLPFGAEAELDLRFRNEWIVYRTVLEHRSYEPELTALILELLKPGDSFIDGGANSGWYTLLAASRVGPTGRVWAIEPSPLPWARLTRNLALNPALAPIVTPCHAALAETSGIPVLIYPHPRHDTSDSLDRPGQGAGVEVPTLRLRDLGAPPHTVVKLDIEGHEYAAWDGWDHSVPATWLIEWEPGFRESRKKLADRLQGRTVYAILPKGLGYRLEAITDHWPRERLNLYLPEP
jgi:FkbM family methyltransferase